jgi:hypothetical protein
MLKLSRTHSILAIAAALASFLPSAIHAQKPALTQNIDERGRSPYYDTVIGSCSGSQCYFNFRVVPAGYRLVVTYASIEYAQFSNSSSVYNVAFFSNGGNGQSGSYEYLVHLPPPTANGAGLYTYSSPITAYAEAGQQPVLDVFNSQPFPVGTISGYLVNLNQ